MLMDKNGVKFSVNYSLMNDTICCVTCNKRREHQVSEQNKCSIKRLPELIVNSSSQQ